MNLNSSSCAQTQIAPLSLHICFHLHYPTSSALKFSPNLSIPIKIVAMPKTEEETYQLLSQVSSSEDVLDHVEDGTSTGFLQGSSQTLRAPPGTGKKSWFRRQIEFVKTNWQFVIILTILQWIMGLLSMDKMFGSQCQCVEHEQHSM